jgi:hypothetical protein
MPVGSDDVAKAEFIENASAIVDFPAPDSPANHSTAGSCSFNEARCSRPPVNVLARRSPNASYRRLKAHS